MNLFRQFFLNSLKDVFFHKVKLIYVEVKSKNLENLYKNITNNTKDNSK